MLAPINCHYNKNALAVTAEHIEGKAQTFTVEAGKALIDSKGCIRFFTVDYGDETHGYVLHPYKTQPQQAVQWVLEFLTGFGLSRLGTKIISRSTPVANLGRYFTFANPGGHLIQSFIPGEFQPEHLGYHNVTTDRLIFPKPIYIQKA